MSQQHAVYDPEWVIEASGSGSFQVECQCGWLETGFDTASSARAAGFAHSTGSRKGLSSATVPEGRKRWWKR